MNAGTGPGVAGRGWAYAGAGLGGAVSIAANIAHSYVPPPADPGHPPVDPEQWHPHAGAVVGAVFWPVALFVAVEIFARVVWPTGNRWVGLRFLGLLPVAAVAAVVSYRHLSGLLAFYGEDVLTTRIGPLAVDGLMVMATGALIATGAGRSLTGTVETGSTVTAPATTRTPTGHATGRGAVTAADTTPDTGADTTPDTGADTTRAGSRTPERTTGRSGRRTGGADTPAAVARLRRRHPDMSSSDIATRLGVSDRTVRRHLAALTTPTTGADSTETANAEADAEVAA
ncbi:MAG: helix-turn-helix domain-containing protein [Actinobacteria bacterium]|nr:helix-turn-helix domain-containing protein [Actinomycetota bacterium]MBI3688564.1 helix-turn-helix domain-containing protein [Actinomycetota bacterium]